MVAFSFSPEFADAVASRKKCQTIRRTMRPGAEVGRKVQLYTGQRTKQCRKLVDEDPTIHRVTEIEIDGHGLKYDGLYQTPETADGYARRDGFENFAAMRKWFFDRYDTDRFVGYEYRWSWEVM